MRIALAQSPGTTLNQWRETLSSFHTALARAAALRADLVLLPECLWPAYYLGSADAYRAVRASGMPGHEQFLELAAQGARRHNLAVCVGFVEEMGGGLRNSAAFIERDGRVAGVHRKCFLWDFDRRWFQAGDEIRPFETEFGPVGIMICADNRLPEIPGTLAARGARLILQPTAWVNGGTPTELWSPQADFLVEARAREFGVTIASCSKWGVEGDTTFVGSSMVCDAAGTRRVQAGTSETTVVVADVEPDEPRVAGVDGPLRAALWAPGAAGREAPPPACDVLTGSGEVRVVVPARKDDPRGAWRAAPAERVLRITAPPGGVAPANGDVPRIRTVAGVAVAVLHAAGLRTYIGPRAAALAGAHLLIALGDDVPTACVQARAAENRVFVVLVGATQVRAFDVTGRPLGMDPEPDGGCSVRLDPTRAATKETSWRTDIFRDRRPAQYEFGAPATACKLTDVR